MYEATKTKPSKEVKKDYFKGSRNKTIIGVIIMILNIGCLLALVILKDLSFAQSILSGLTGVLVSMVAFWFFASAYFKRKDEVRLKRYVEYVN